MMTATRAARLGRRSNSNMRYFVRLGTAAYLICNALLSFATNNSSSAGQNQQEPPATSSSQAQVPDGREPASTSSAVVTRVLAKVCMEKNPPPCATPPRPTFSPPPEYSSKARKAHYQGVCTLSVIVETNGHTSDIRVLNALGMGLDEKAIEAMKRWKFKPAMQDGKPVPVQIAIEVVFHIDAR
jgi:TonB family protein